jgi:hypothetical protein
VRRVRYASGAAAADARCRVRRGVAAHPAELQRAHEAAAGMGKDPVVDDDEGEGDEDAWVE